MTNQEKYILKYAPGLTQGGLKIVLEDWNKKEKKHRPTKNIGYLAHWWSKGVWVPNI